VHELATTKHTQIAGYNNSWETIKDNLARFVPDEVDQRKIAEQAFFLVRRNPKLLDCSLESFAAFLIRANSLKLDPLIPNMCWPIPRKGEVTFQYGYLGLRELAMRSGKYRNVFAHCVYEGDSFAVEYISGDIHHRPAFRDRGELLCVYAVAISNQGHADAEVMTIDQVKAIQKRSAGVNKGRSTPWDTDWDEMARKTVLKRLCKRLDLSAEAARAMYEEDPPIIDATTSTPPINLDALPKVQKPAALPEPAPVDEAVEVPQHELGNVPSLGKTTLSKCLRQGILTERQLYDAIAAGKKPSGIRSVSVDYLLAKFGGEQASEPETAPSEPQGSASAPAVETVGTPVGPRTGHDVPVPVARLLVKLVAGQNAGMLPVDVIHSSLIDAGMEASAADALIGAMVAERSHNWNASTDLDNAKLWRACLDQAK
jgi:recombination protein RecT